MNENHLEKFLVSALYLILIVNTDVLSLPFSFLFLPALFRFDLFVAWLERMSKVANQSCSPV